MTQQLVVPVRPALTRLAFWLALAAVCCLLATPAIAADTKEQQKFKDWRLRCRQPEGADKEVCQLMQNIVLKEGNRPLLHVAVGFLPEREHPGAILTLPLGISLPPGIVLQVDEGNPRKLPVEHCIRAGCRVFLALDDELLASFKAGIEAQVTFYDVSRQAVGVPISLRGFTAGFNALGKLHTARNPG